MIEEIRHIGIVVDNLDISLSFYARYFGFKVEREEYEQGVFIDKILGMSGIKIRTVKLKCQASDVLIELIDFIDGGAVDNDNGINYVGLTHFAITVKNIEKEYNKMKKSGVNFLSPPKSSPNGYAKVAFCQAPEGTYIEMVEII